MKEDIGTGSAGGSAVPIIELLRAVRFAANKHRKQTRKGKEASPYINHPIEVAECIATTGGVYDLATLQAAILHDTIEDTETSRAEIEQLFGPEVADLVAEVTDDKSLAKASRKELQIEHAPTLSRKAKLVKIADKVCNVRDVTHEPPLGWDLRRRREYLDWAEKVVNACGPVNADLENYFCVSLCLGRETLESGLD